MHGSTDAVSNESDSRIETHQADKSLQSTGQPTPTLLMPEERARCAAVYLVRHGETEWNTQDILQGHLDSALTERGLAQASELVDRFRDVVFAAIFSSDVTRAQRTAGVIALERKMAVGTSKLLRERNWGRYDGVAAQRYREECKELIERYNALSREHRWSFKLFDDIESFEEIFGRFITFLREVAAANAGQNVLCVTHRDVLGALLIKLGYAPLSIANMAWVKLLSDGSLMQIEETGGIEFEQQG
ncbi:MAG: histidine phosphatase family protein [Burkholderiaceae bacterium]